MSRGGNLKSKAIKAKNDKLNVSFKILVKYKLRYYLNNDVFEVHY